MTRSKLHHYKPLISTKEEVHRLRERAKKEGKPPSLSAHKLAFSDSDFLLREELRPVRLQLELLKPELLLQDYDIKATIVFFGSARIPAPEVLAQQIHDLKEQLKIRPKDDALKTALKRAEAALKNSAYLKEAEKLAYMISKAYGTQPGMNFVVATGGGPSFMQAANKGAFDAGGRSIALNIMLPHEQHPNTYVTPELTFQFHYFAIRKMHFFIRAHAMVAFPGGFGTCDELFDALTLMQTNKMQNIPILLFNETYWRRVLNFEAMLDEGMISEKDLALFQYVETAEQAWDVILEFYHLNP